MQSTTQIPAGRDSDLERGAIAPTPGPWAVREGRHIFAASGQVASVYGDVYIRMPESEHAANARLIAAAPDMLAALRRAVLALAFAAESSPAMRDDYEAVSDAIERATQPA